MTTRWKILLSVVLVLVIVTISGLLVARARPLVSLLSPAPDSLNVPARTSIRLAFSQPMQIETVEARLSFEPERSGSFTWQGQVLEFTPDKLWPSGSMVTVHLASGARAAGWLGLSITKGTSWSFFTSQTLLAYLWPASGSANLYALDPATGDIRQLTTRGGVLDFSTAPDGLRIYFSQDENGPAGQGSSIYALDRLAQANQPEDILSSQLILPCPQEACRFPEVSPNGQWLAYERTPLASGSNLNTSVWLLFLEDKRTWQIGALGHTTRQPAWSAQGWLSFYDQEAQAFILYHPEQEAHKLLPNQTGETGAWLPDGSAYIAPEIFIETLALLEARASSHLIRFNLVNGELRSTTDLTGANDLEDTSPAVSPDGLRLAFARKYLDNLRWSPGRQVWMLDLTSSPNNPPAQQVTADPFYNHYDFAWSLDSQQLAYVRFNQVLLTEPPELWLMRADGSHPVQLVIGGFSPQWLP